MAGRLRDPGPQARRVLSDLAADDGAERPVEALPDAPVGALEEWSLDQLHRRASEVGLDGRWDMTRDELVVALREPEQPVGG